MNKRISLVAVVGIGAALMAGCGKTNAPQSTSAPPPKKAPATTQPAEQAETPKASLPKAIADNRAKGNYTVLILHKGEDITALKAGMQPLASEAEKCELLAMRADNAGLTSFFAKQRVDPGSMPTPIVLMLAPNGVVSGVFTKTPTKESFAEAILPEEPLAVRKALLDGKTVIIKMQSSTTTGNKETDLAIKKFLAAPKNSASHVSVAVHLDKKENRTFFRQLGIDPDKETASTILGMAPPLKIINKPFRGAATVKDVVDVVTPACTTGCGPIG